MLPDGRSPTVSLARGLRAPVTWDATDSREASSEPRLRMRLSVMAKIKALCIAILARTCEHE